MGMNFQRKNFKISALKTTESPHVKPSAPKSRQQVRIIGGEFRRRQLDFSGLTGIRPTSDRVRETLFNWLGQDLTGLDCLDAFAGSGALGFEAASRHARSVLMLEQSSAIVARLRQHQNTLGARVQIQQADTLAFLAQCTQTFDLVFCDPPFAADNFARLQVLVRRVLRDDGLFYFENQQWPTEAELAGWTVWRSARAGAVFYGLLRQAA